jgi:hypothetical protein
MNKISRIMLVSLLLILTGCNTIGPCNGNIDQLGQPPVGCNGELNPLNAANQYKNKATLGPAMWSGLPESVTTAISLYGTYQKVQPMLAGAWDQPNDTVGLDFSQMRSDGFTPMIDLVQKANANGVPTELRVGGTGTYNPCPTGTACFEVDFAGTGWANNTYKTDMAIEPNSVINWFAIDANQLKDHQDLISAFDEGFQVAPFPNASYNESDPTAIFNIARNTLPTIKSGGHYVIYLNPYHNADNAQAITNDQLAQVIADAVQGQGSFEWGMYPEMKAKYPSLIKDALDSAYISPELLNMAPVVVITKN